MILLESGQLYLWQWNTNQRIVIDDESVEVVSFSTNGIDAVRREVYQDAERRCADIPNKLLQTNGSLYVYAHRMEQERFTTMLESVFLIHGQPKPPDYIDKDDEVLIWHQLEERVKQHAADAAASADRAEQAANHSGYIAFEVDKDGNLIYTKTASVEVTFEIREGDLRVHG